MDKERLITFREWLAQHKAHFDAGRYEPWEIARIALVAGFTMAEIAPPCTEWLTRSRRTLKLFENPLARQWAELCAYQRRGVDWD